MASEDFEAVASEEGNLDFDRKATNRKATDRRVTDLRKTDLRTIDRRATNHKAKEVGDRDHEVKEVSDCDHDRDLKALEGERMRLGEHLRLG